MTPLEREQLGQFWQDVDRATEVIELVNTPAHERDPYQIPDEYSTDRHLYDRLEARRAAEESIQRLRNARTLYDRDEAPERIAYDNEPGVMRDWQELEHRLHRRMYANGDRPDPTDWREVRESMDAFHGKLLELRMMEEQNRREGERFGAWVREQRELESGRPAPGPDGDLVPQRELDEAQDRMVEEMERPLAHEPYNWIEAARAEVERQYGPDPGRASPGGDDRERERAGLEQGWEAELERSFDTDRKRDR
jgi:hypothetical protein